MAEVEGECAGFGGSHVAVEKNTFDEARFESLFLKSLSVLFRGCNVN